jgi:hypothetical protein
MPTGPFRALGEHVVYDASSGGRRVEHGCPSSTVVLVKARRTSVDYKWKRGDATVRRARITYEGDATWKAHLGGFRFLTITRKKTAD